MKYEIDGKLVSEAEWLEAKRKRIEANLDALGKMILESGILSDEQRDKLLHRKWGAEENFL